MAVDLFDPNNEQFPYGRFSAVWFRAVIYSLKVSVPLVYLVTSVSFFEHGLDVHAFRSIGAIRVVWTAYFVAQTLNILPIAYRLPHGLEAVHWFVNASAALLSTFAFVWGWPPLPRPFWWLSSAILLVSLVSSYREALVAMERNPGPTTRRQRLQLAGLSIWLNLPMLFASIALGAA